jgi:hypothetical protein
MRQNQRNLNNNTHSNGRKGKKHTNWKEKGRGHDRGDVRLTAGTHPKDLTKMF